MKVLLSVFAILCVCSIYSQNETDISDISEKTVYDMDATAQLICSVSHPKNFNISWMKVNVKNVVLTYGNNTVINNSRFSLRQDIIATKLYNINAYTLLINGIKMSDAGIYRCQVILGPNKTISAETELVVRGPVSPKIFNITKPLVVTEGMPFKLECYASGSPVPIIYWRREGTITLLSTGGLFHRGNILEVPDAKKGDSGRFSCIADNNVGLSVLNKTEVVVVFSPIITVSKHYYEELLYHYVDLDCHIESCPMAEVIWLFNGEQLFDNQFYTITDFVKSDLIKVSTLRISLQKKNLFGIYVCKAFNTLGSTEMKINVVGNLKKNMFTSI